MIEYEKITADSALKDTRHIVRMLEEAYELRLNNLQHALSLSEKALNKSKQIRNKKLIGKSLNQIALFYMIQGGYKKSIQLSQKAITCFEELKDKKGIANAKYNIGSVYYKTDNYHLGLVYMMECLTIYKSCKDHHNMARVQKSLGTIYEYFGDKKNALKVYESAIRSSRLAGDINLESNVYNPLSGIYLKENQVKKAEEIILKSIKIKKKTRDIRGLAFAIYGLGKVNKHKRKFKEAEENFLESIKIHTEMSEKLGICMSYNKLGTLYHEMGEIENAKKTLQTGIEISRQSNIILMQYKGYYQLYLIYKKEGNSDKALHYHEKYMQIKETVINSQNLKIAENYELLNRLKTIETKSKQQKKLSDEMLRLSNERYEMASKATRDVIWDWDIKKNKIYRSANYEFVFGHPKAENNIYIESWVDNLYPDDKIRVFDNVFEKIEDPESHLWEDEYRYYRANGELAIVYDRGYILRDENKKALRIIGAMMDVTQQKNHEKEKEKMTNDILQRNKNLEQFAYIISHNLRGPVANILGFSDLIKQYSNVEGDIGDFMDAIIASAHNLDTVVRDLNTILQVKGELNESKELIEFDKLMEEVKIGLPKDLANSNITLITNFRDIKSLYTLKSYLYSIFFNLISNSIKYRKPDSKTIIEVSSKKMENGVQIRFNDNGLGIDLEKKGDQVFGLYKRFHPNTEGKGIGLFMTKTQVEALGGTITLKSQPGMGTEFSIHFDY
ncbi:MAG: tetratricopeptide repeat protein [Flavobacteriales bacterium]|nr:tetratricopeptide repeat protein [Flavobacteriales bacterium]